MKAHHVRTKLLPSMCGWWGQGEGEGAAAHEEMGTGRFLLFVFTVTPATVLVLGSPTCGQRKVMAASNHSPEDQFVAQMQSNRFGVNQRLGSCKMASSQARLWVSMCRCWASCTQGDLR
jgi:hypothetical protein